MSAASAHGTVATWRRTGRQCLAALVCLTASAWALAVGPERTAVPDRSLWPDAIDSPAAFDRASRAETLAFASALSRSEAMDAATLQAALGVKRVDAASVDRIRARYWSRLFDNYRLASAACTGDGDAFCTAVGNVTAFKKIADAFPTADAPRYAAWQRDAAQFHQTYLAELLRLAALFPRISSEIDRFDDSELDGSDMADRHFLLTFDDGPTPKGGDTDKTLDMLRGEGLSATFFVLGDALERRTRAAGADTQALYADQCVGTHGWEHKSHASWPQWQDSVIRSATLARASAGPAWRPLFRPPYGQRRVDSAAFFKEQHLQVMLWTMDSQDWNQKMSADAVQQRMVSLMLLWRHGVMLFHDVHPKARVALPGLLKQLHGAGVTFVDCHEAPAALE